uniref:Uncharacterized protein n=1 Tax=Ixodes ricinus TaxID=34613 RepID=A0A6B0U0D4_IXORI
MATQPLSQTYAFALLNTATAVDTAQHMEAECLRSVSRASASGQNTWTCCTALCSLLWMQNYKLGFFS